MKSVLSVWIFGSDNRRSLKTSVHRLTRFGYEDLKTDEIIQSDCCGKWIINLTKIVFMSAYTLDG